MKKKSPIILDTNIWISYLLSKKFHLLVRIILFNQMDVITCTAMTQEIEDVLSREKFSKYITNDDINEALNIHHKLCKPVDINVKGNYLSDPKDNYLIDLFKASGAEYIVSGDKQLIEQGNKIGVKVISLNEFKSIMKQ